jgi:hypothetical protein
MTFLREKVVESLPANGRENGHDLQKMNHEQLTTKYCHNHQQRQ